MARRSARRSFCKPIRAKEERNGLPSACQGVMLLAYQLTEDSGIKHPFKNSTAGHKWLETFRSRLPNLICMSLSIPKHLKTSLLKLGTICAHFKLLNEPMQVFNDESGVNVMQHKGKVITEGKRRGVYRVVATQLLLVILLLDIAFRNR